MKPDRSTAIRKLIKQIREDFSFEIPEVNVCSGQCKKVYKVMQKYDFIDV